MTPQEALPIIQALANGEQCQILSPPEGYWLDFQEGKISIYVGCHVYTEAHLFRVKPKPRQWFAVIDKAGRYSPMLFETRVDADAHALRTGFAEIIHVEEKL